MGLEHTRWWHWTLISLLMGWTLAYFNSSPIEPLSRFDAVGSQFELAVLHQPANGGVNPFVRNLVVYPSVMTRDSSAHQIQVMPVLYDELVHKAGGAPDEYQYRPTWFCSRVPYVTTGTRPTLDPNDPNSRELAAHLPPGIERRYTPVAEDTLPSIAKTVYGQDTIDGEEAIRTCNFRIFRHSDSIQKLIDGGRYFKLGESILIPHNPDGQSGSVRDWLTEAASAYPWVQYKYAWWRDPRYTNYVWMAPTFVIVGVIWPILLAVMSKAGLGGSKLAMQQYDLSRFGTKKPKPKPAAAAASKGDMSDAGREQLAAMNQSLMSELTDVAGEEGKAPPAVASDKPAAKEFVVAPSESKPPVPLQKPEEERDFSGEFYPVAHPKTKADEPKEGKD
jgi:hypothetical protein